MMEYRIVRSDRKSVAIHITPEGEVLVRCPRKLPKKEIARIVEGRRDWIEGHLAKIAENNAIVPLKEAEFKALFHEAARVIPEKCAYFAQLAQVGFGRITLRCQRTRWGSCSREGNLNFNCLLLLAPESVLDYVIVHELCHRKEMNHSARFWAEVAAILPNYAEPRRWLKENGGALLARRPK